jgi:hypothetical protein
MDIAGTIERVKKAPYLRIFDAIGWFSFFFLAIYLLMNGIINVLTGPGTKGLFYKRIYDNYYMIFIIIFGISFIEAVILKYYKKYKWKHVVVSALLIASILIASLTHLSELDYRGPGAYLLGYIIVAGYPIFIVLMLLFSSILLIYTISAMKRYPLLDWGAVVLVIVSLLSMPSFRAVAVMSKDIDFHIKFVGSCPGANFENMRVDIRIYQSDYSYEDKAFWLNQEGYYHLVGVRGSHFRIRNRKGCRAIINVRSDQYKTNSKEKPFIIKPESRCKNVIQQ